ncbi:hypothetical protein DFH09DRAFT_1070541 [Mycena vulgaris]|nr:hypothetical protein DFH09DRAFT_1070541 [Mycena vulgaris]
MRQRSDRTARRQWRHGGCGDTGVVRELGARGSSRSARVMGTRVQQSTAGSPGASRVLAAASSLEDGVLRAFVVRGCRGASWRAGGEILLHAVRGTSPPISGLKLYPADRGESRRDSYMNQGLDKGFGEWRCVEAQQIGSAATLKSDYNAGHINPKIRHLRDDTTQCGLAAEDGTTRGEDGITLDAKMISMGEIWTKS